MTAESAPGAPGTPRFALTLPLAFNHAWGEIWRARARIRVLVEVVLGGE